MDFGRVFSIRPMGCQCVVFLSFFRHQDRCFFDIKDNRRV
jgi:hypothetical protein